MLQKFKQVPYAISYKENNCLTPIGAAINECFSTKKELSDDQYFKNDFKDIIKPLPVINSWIDDSHVNIIRENKLLHYLNLKTEFI